MSVSNPRPWFITLTTKWHWSSDFHSLKQLIAESQVVAAVPFHQRILDELQWHSTIMALLKIERWPDSSTAEEVASKGLAKMSTIVKGSLRDLLPFDGFSLLPF